MTVAQLALEAMRLPVVSRAELVDKLVESLQFTTDEDVREAWAVEAKNRLDDIRAGRVQSIPGDEVFAEIRQILSR